MNKKGISLIVLVITIIVMIIIAGAIILSLNSSNVTSKASWAKISSDRANLQSEFATILADEMAKANGDLTTTELEATAAYSAWATKVTNAGFTVTKGTTVAGYSVTYTMTSATAESYGLTVSGDKVTGYDWVKISG